MDRAEALLPEDRESRQWIRLREYMQGRIAMLRASNDESLPAKKTARLRGQIAELKHLLSLEKDGPVEAHGADDSA